MTQLSFDDLARGTKYRPICRWCKRTNRSGTVIAEGMVFLGRCTLLGDNAYTERCETCESWEARA